MSVDFYKEHGPLGYLANYSNHGFTVDGVYYKTAEHYYQANKNSVDKYGTKTPAMQITPEEHTKLVAILAKQNKQRSEHVEQCRTAGLSEFYTKLNTPSSTNQEMDFLSR